jgi:uncharacterized iron-regulated membrane protein
VLRKVHRWVGLIVGPLLIVTAIIGATMVLLDWFDPNARMVGFETRRFLTNLHNYRLASEWATLILSVGVLTMASTGLSLWGQSWLRRRKSQRLARRAAERGG